MFYRTCEVHLLMSDFAVYTKYQSSLMILIKKEFMMNIIRTISFISMILFLTFSGRTYSSEYSSLTISGNEFTVVGIVLSTVLHKSSKLPLSEYMDGPRAAIETGGFILNQMWMARCINPTIAIANFTVNLGARTAYRFLEQHNYIAKEMVTKEKCMVEKENGVFEEREYRYLRSPLKEAFKIFGPQAAAYLITMALVGC
jgi:hypothetical protein